MSTRDDILTELGLVPTWRRREAGPPAAPSAQMATPAPDREVRGAPHGGVADDRTEASGAVHASEPDRLQRIARLEWRDFAADVDGCTACGLARTRNKCVPGVGDEHAELLLVGEAPGAEEDAKGEPFVGQAGRLLDNMLAALGLKRGANVYIANVLKCRPPNNRVPEPREIEACRPYLDRQVALLQPRLVIALGRSAATTLLGVDASIASLRGRVHRYAGLPLVVTYHPAYLLRSLPDKAKAWEDLLFARRTLRGTAGPAPGQP